MLDLSELLVMVTKKIAVLLAA